MLCFDHVVIRRCRVCLEAYFVLLTSAPGLEPASNREVLQLLECGKFSIFRWCRETVPGNFPFLLRFFLQKNQIFYRYRDTNRPRHRTFHFTASCFLKKTRGSCSLACFRYRNPSPEPLGTVWTCDRPTRPRKIRKLLLAMQFDFGALSFETNFSKCVSHSDNGPVLNMPL